MRGHRAVGENGVEIASCQPIREPVVEFARPGIDRAVLFIQPDPAEVVHDAAAADQQNPAVAQRGDRPADTDEIGGCRRARQRNLDHRRLSPRKHQAQGDPDAMVPTAPVLGGGVQTRPGEKRDDFLRETRIARRRVGHRVKLIGKAVEVVDQPWSGGGRDSRRCRRFPMSRHDDDGAKRPCRLSKARQRADAYDSLPHPGCPDQRLRTCLGRPSRGCHPVLEAGPSAGRSSRRSCHRAGDRAPCRATP